MGNSPMGIIIGLGMDPSDAQTAMQQFEKTMGSGTSAAAQSVEGAGKRMRGAMTDAEENFRLVGEEIGVHMPRSVTRALGQMMPSISTITTALLGMWAISKIPEFIEGVESAGRALSGYTEQVRKAEKADIDASTSALIHFTTIAQGTLLIAQTNAALANLAAKQGNWQEEAKAANAVMNDSKSVWLSLLGPIASARISC